MLLVALVGCGDSSDDTGESSTGSGQTTSGTNTEESGTDTTTDVQSSSTTTSDDTTTSTGQSDTGPPSPCDLACDVSFECSDAYESMEECRTSCEAQFEPGEPAADSPCREATEAWLLCIAGLDCEQYVEWEESTMNEPGPYPCKEADAGIFDSCYGTNTSSS